MNKRPLVLAIYDPRWFMEVLRILRSRSISYTLYDDPSNIPYFSVLYTDYYYFVEETRSREDVTIIYDPGKTIRGLEKSILATMFKQEYSELTIGIDPGENPYYVVIGDGEILSHGYVSVNNITGKIREIIENVPARKKSVKVGTGYNGLYLAFVLNNSVEADIELVDEYETTPRSNRSSQTLTLNEKLRKMLKPYRNKDAYAALRIALRKGLLME